MPLDGSRLVGRRNHLLDCGIYWRHHLANTIERSVLGYDAITRYQYCGNLICFIDRVAGEIIRLVASVSVRVSVCLWALSCLNRLTFDLDFWHEGRP